MGLQLVLCHLLAALQAGIRLAEGDVAGGVLVEQGVVIEDPLVGDGAVIGHQGHLAEVAGPLVHGDGGLQGLLPLLRADLHDLPVLHGEAELVDNGAVVAQRQGGAHHAVDAGLQGGGEHLLRGDVGDIGPAGEGHVVAGLPDVALRQLHRQVRAQGIGVVQGLEVQLVELFHPALQRGDVRLPLLHTVPRPGDADRGEDGVPQPLLRLVRRQVREHLLRPAGDGDGGDAPGEAAAHLQPVKVLQRRAAGLLGPDDAAVVHAPEVLRVAGGDGQIRRPLQGVVVVEVAPPQRHGVEHIVGGVEVLHPSQFIVAPVHHHLPAAGVVGLRRTESGEEGALHRRGDHQGLALFHVEAHPHQQPGVFLQFFFHLGIHVIPSFPGLSRFSFYCRASRRQSKGGAAGIQKSFTNPRPGPSAGRSAWR